MTTSRAGKSYFGRDDSGAGSISQSFHTPLKRSRQIGAQQFLKPTRGLMPIEAAFEHIKRFKANFRRDTSAR
jgi:hypothetical protein